MDNDIIYETEIVVVKIDEQLLFCTIQKRRMFIKAKVYNKEVEVSLEEMKDRVIGYYDATGVKHFYQEVDNMSEDEIKELYENSFASE